MFKSNRNITITRLQTKLCNLFDGKAAQEICVITSRKSKTQGQPFAPPWSLASLAMSWWTDCRTRSMKLAAWSPYSFRTFLILDPPLQHFVKAPWPLQIQMASKCAFHSMTSSRFWSPWLRSGLQQKVWRTKLWRWSRTTTPSTTLVERCFWKTGVLNC